MGSSAAETVREIEETRSRLESDIRDLEERLPKPALWAKRAVGVAVGGGIGGSVFWFGVRRVRKRRKQKAEAAKATQAVFNVIPTEWADRVGRAVESGEWKGWLVLAGTGWLVFRLAELRQLRKMNRLMLASGRPAQPTLT